MTIRIDLSPEQERKAAVRAAERGQDVQAYLADVVEREIDRPTLHEILAPVHDEVRKSGASDAAIDEVLQQAIRASRAARRAQNRPGKA